MKLLPHLSEKTIALADAENTYCFYAPKDANKHSIAREIERRFDVKVVNVRAAILKGKPKRMPVQRGRRIITGARSDMKKAYITLGEGDSISLFEGAE